MRHLDTSIVVAYLRGNGNVIRKLQAHFGDLAISAVVLAKLRFGARVSAHPEKNIQSVKDFSSLVIPFDEQSAMAYGDLRASLRTRGKQTGDSDALITATALANKAVLVTHNVQHFENIEGLEIENWVVET